MNTKGSVTVLFFCFIAIFTLTDCSTCDISILQGQSLTFKLADRPLKDDDTFTVKRDNKLAIRKRAKIDGPGIVKNEMLEVQNVKLSDAGQYHVEVYDGSGTKITSYSKQVCVYEKVPKPTVNVTCQNEKAVLRCDVEGDKDLNFIWQKNGKDTKDTSKVLKNVNADNSKYTCTAKNPVHSNTSDPVEATCSNPNTLFGFDFWIMVSILAGGGGLVLLLMIVLVTAACCACKRREKQQRDEEEFRLNYLSNAPAPGHEKSKKTARGQPAPPEPEPYDNVSPQEVPCQTEPKPRTQQRARPPPPPIDDDEEQPPPLPQPRKKAQVKKREPL